MRPIAMREPEWQNRLACSQDHCTGVQYPRIGFGPHHRLCIHCIEPIVLYRTIWFGYDDGAGAADWDVCVEGDDYDDGDCDLWRLKLDNGSFISAFVAHIWALHRHI